MKHASSVTSSFIFTFVSTSSDVLISSCWFFAAFSDLFLFFFPTNALRNLDSLSSGIHGTLLASSSSWLCECRGIIQGTLAFERQPRRQLRVTVWLPRSDTPGHMFEQDGCPRWKWTSTNTKHGVSNAHAGLYFGLLYYTAYGTWFNVTAADLAHSVTCRKRSICGKDFLTSFVLSTGGAARP